MLLHSNVVVKTSVVAGVIAGMLLVTATAMSPDTAARADTPSVAAASADAGLALRDGTANVIPSLDEWNGSSDTTPFVLSAALPVTYDDQSLAPVAETLVSNLTMLSGVELKTASSADATAGGIHLQLVDKSATDTGAEGYKLTIGDSVTIAANTTKGAFYGTRTVLQMLGQGGEERDALPRGEALDAPKYPVRALMLDVARAFVSVDFIKQYIRQMAWFKMNLLHLHLSDNEAFRLESNVPGLTADKHYTKAQIADLVKYAAQYQVTILPEIDVPGHATSMLKARPDLRHTCSALSSRGDLDLSNPDTETFVKSLIDEYQPLFGGMFHIGTDEYPYAGSQTWKGQHDLLVQCPELVQMADDKGYSDVGDIYRDFINDMNNYIKSKGVEPWLWTWFDFVGSNVTIQHDDDGPIIDDWLGENVQQKSGDGFKLVNSSGGYTYVMPGRRVLNRQWMYENWNPSIWSPLAANEHLDPSDPNLLGAKLNLWNPPAWTPYLPEASFDSELSEILKVFADKDWGGQNLGTYADFADAAARVGNAPGHGFGQIGEYRFDSTDNVAVDTSFAGNNGTLYGPTQVEGHSGNGLSFSGGPDHVFLGAPDVAGDWTASFWVNRSESGQSSATILDSEHGAILLEQEGTDGKVGITNHDSAAAYSFDYSAPVGTWVHLTLAGNADSTNLYADGVKVDTIDHGISLPRRDIGAKTNSFAGVLDNLKFFDFAVDARGAESLHKGLVIDYNFDESSGTAVLDQSGLGNNGVLSKVTRATGHDGGGLEFTNDEGMVYTGHPRGYSGNWTASLWIDRKDMDASAEILFSSAETGYSLRSAQYKTGRLGVTQHGDSERSDKPPVVKSWDNSYDVTLDPGKWTHVTFVGDDRGTSVYLDGTLSGTLDRDIEMPMQFIGVEDRASSSLTGTIDDVRFFDRALTDTEIKVEAGVLTEVTPADVTFTDNDGTDKDSFTVPSVDGVEYLVDGEIVAAGKHPGAGSVTVTARAADRFTFSDGSTTKWSHTFSADGGEPPVVEVTPVNVTFADESGTKDDTFIVPNVSGVEYTGSDGTALEPGTHHGVGKVVIRAHTLERFIFADGSKTQWSYTFDAKGAEPTVPTTPGSEPDESGGLASTGSQITGGLIAGGLFFGAGIALLTRRRRRLMR